MPELGLFLLLARLKSRVLFHLQNEPDLGRVAEVRDGQMADLEDERLSSKLQLVLTLLDQVLELESLQLHDVTDAQGRQVLALVQVAQDVLHVERCILALEVLAAFDLGQIYNEIIIVVEV